MQAAPRVAAAATAGFVVVVALISNAVATVIPTTRVQQDKSLQFYVA